MAITAVEYTLFSELKKSRLFPLRPSFLELGEANWYGDVPYEQLSNDICLLLEDPEEQIRLLQELIDVVRAGQPNMLWDVAKIFYRLFLEYRETVAIDFDGTGEALRLDLNQPITLDKQFDIVFNGGTAEHVFNIWQFFKTVHEHTAIGGLMIHGGPFTGWLDHGFYSFNPTFYWDLAAANGYTILFFLYTELMPLKIVRLSQREQLAEMVKDGQIGTNSNLYVVFRKPFENRSFTSPQQGYYADAVSSQVRETWMSLR
jgi:hypothetical protein